MQLSTADADAVENVINNRILQLFALHYTLIYSQENIGNISNFWTEQMYDFKTN